MKWAERAVHVCIQGRVRCQAMLGGVYAMQIKSDGIVVGICTNNALALAVPGNVTSAKKIVGTAANVLAFQVKPLSTSFAGNSPLAPVNSAIADLPQG